MTLSKSQGKLTRASGPGQTKAEQAEGTWGQIFVQDPTLFLDEVGELIAPDAAFPGSSRVLRDGVPEPPEAPPELAQVDPSPSIQLEKKGVTLQSQEEFWVTAGIWRESISTKLWELGRYDLAQSLRECHTVATDCLCLDCGHHQTWWNRCDRFYCPSCTRRLAYKRRKSIAAWVDQVKQPKHVVLTARNTWSFSRVYVRWFKDRLRSLIRSSFARSWEGGLYSLEVTNEGRGWHLHAHCLLEADWVDAQQLAIQWGKRLTQDFAIVKVKDVRAQSYLQEVTKYAVKGSELARWTGHEIATFIDAMTGTRTFGTFGSLYKLRAELRQVIDAANAYTPACEKCESERLKVDSPEANEFWEAQHGSPRLRTPPGTGRSSHAPGQLDRA